MKQLFRALVVASLMAYVIWFFMPYVSPHLFSTETLDLLSWSSHGAAIELGAFAPFVFLLTYGVLSIGLISFKRWARTGFLLITIISLLLAPLSGISVQTQIDTTLVYFISLCDGAILSIAFLTGINSEFQTAV